MKTILLALILFAGTCFAADPNDDFLVEPEIKSSSTNGYVIFDNGDCYVTEPNEDGVMATKSIECESYVTTAPIDQSEGLLSQLHILWIEDGRKESFVVWLINKVIKYNLDETVIMNP